MAHFCLLELAFRPQGDRLEDGLVGRDPHGLLGGAWTQVPHGDLGAWILLPQEEQDFLPSFPFLASQQPHKRVVGRESPGVFPQDPHGFFSSF